jgi:lysozyme
MPGFASCGFSRLARQVALAATALLMAGCAGDYYPTKSDARPHPGVARALTLPVHGIDIARYQGNIDWHAVKAAGTKFAFIKATEGGDYIDPMFATNWAGAKAAGVPRGAYHFVYWCRPAHEQAQWFIQHIPQDRDALPPVLDLEWNTSSRTCPQKVDKATAIEKARLMLRELEQHTGKRPIIYTDITFHREVLAGEAEFDRYPFWLRSVAAEPHERYHARRWMFWQFTATGRVPGIRGDVDRNAFYGTEREWNDFIATDCDPRDRHHHEHATRCGGTSPRQAFAPTTRPTAVGEAAPTPGTAKPASTSTPAVGTPAQVPEPEQKPGESPVDLDDPPVTSTLPRTSPLTQALPKPARPAVAIR